MTPTSPLRRATASLVVLCVALGACGGDDDAATTTTTSTTATETTAGSTPSTTGAPVEEVPSLDEVTVVFTQVAVLDQPVAMAVRPGSDDLWVAEKTGRVQRLTPAGDGWEVAGTVLDLRGQVSGATEQGLLGIAFSPDGDRLYADFTDPAGTTNVVAYPMNGDVADQEAGVVLLEVAQPFSNHNGGHLLIGPDDHLYVGLGDGGSAGDPQDNGQNPDTLLGSILRIDPDGGDPYAIPDDNPFVDGGGAPEVFLYGVRNPWRFTFDSETGDLWVADVGQNRFEEVTVLRADGDAVAGRGANLGWNELEGLEPFEGGSSPEGAVDPIHVYSRDGGCSVTGGVVPRGSSVPGLDGLYLFSDYCQSTLRLLRDDGDTAEVRAIETGVPSIVSFGVDAEGEVYLLSREGPVVRLDPASEASAER